MKVKICGEYTADDGLRVEIPVDAHDFWANLQSGTCADCGGTWVWAENGSVPGTRQCGGCGSVFTVLGRNDDDDGGESAKARYMAVLRRQRYY